MGMADRKVKAAEGEEVIFPNPHLDFTGSGMTFTIYSGIPSGEPPMGGTEAIGGGGGGGYVAPDTSTQVTFGGRIGVPREPAPTVYMALCFQQHALDAPGVDGNGNWNSGVIADCATAFSIAAGHEHTVDRVEQITGPVGIPISGC
jgi:hypothetical protein